MDQAAKVLRERGIDNYMVEVGGEVAVHGVKPNGQLWRLAVIGPEMGRTGVSALVEPGNKSLATSGDYLNYFEVDGKRYSHTINPATGWPEAKRVAEVAVIADTTAKADALATMFMVLGDEQGLTLANRRGIAARFAYYTNDGFATVTSEALSPIWCSSRKREQPEILKEASAMATVLITFCAFLILIAAMAVGVIFSNKPIKGSCGGLSSLGLKDGCVICGGDKKETVAKPMKTCSMTPQLAIKKS